MESYVPPLAYGVRVRLARQVIGITRRVYRLTRRVIEVYS